MIYKLDEQELKKLKKKDAPSLYTCEDCGSIFKLRDENDLSRTDKCEDCLIYSNIAIKNTTMTN